MIDYEKALNDISIWCDEVGSYQMKKLEDRSFNIYNKDCDINYVTDVDLKSERMLIERITESYPLHAVLGEEYGSSREDEQSGYVWVIDPIDGTINYIHRFPTFCISIALKYKGKTKVGMIYAPMMNMKYTAIEGRGAYLNKQKISVSGYKDFVNCLLCSGFNTNRLEDNINLKYFNYLIEHVCDIRQIGSAALALCLTAGGLLDGFWHFDLKEWDYCAGELIVREAGRVVNHYKKNGHNLLISGNKNVYDSLENTIYRDVFNGDY